MYERGDIVIFRPVLFSNKYDHLTVGIIQSVRYDFVLIGRQSNEKRKELLSIRVVGEYQATSNYPDNLNKITNCAKSCCSGLRCWHQVRREVLVSDLNTLKGQRDCHIDIARTLSSDITDLDILFASQILLSEKGCMTGLHIQGVQADAHVYRPSSFHSKIEKAKGALKENNELSVIFEFFNKWLENVSDKIVARIDAAIMIQKIARRFCARDSLEKQRRWKKWWSVQKEFWFGYLNCNDGALCYKVCGNKNYFNMKVLADQWKLKMKKAIDIIEAHAGNRVSCCLNEAIRKWNLSLTLQKHEMKLMLHEDFLSSYLRHDEK